MIYGKSVENWLDFWWKFSCSLWCQALVQRPFSYGHYGSLSTTVKVRRHLLVKFHGLSVSDGWRNALHKSIRFIRTIMSYSGYLYYTNDSRTFFGKSLAVWCSGVKHPNVNRCHGLDSRPHLWYIAVNLTTNLSYFCQINIISSIQWSVIQTTIIIWLRMEHKQSLCVLRWKNLQYNWIWRGPTLQLININFLAHL